MKRRCEQQAISGPDQTTALIQHAALEMQRAEVHMTIVGLLHFRQPKPSI